MVPVSICLTTYNRAKVLPNTLNSLLAQTYAEFELIISDDCSPDETEEVCREYARRDSRVKYYQNKTNLKMPGNLNAAIGRASGTYIANVHDGDVYHADLIRKWKLALDAVPEAPFVFNGYRAVQRDGSVRNFVQFPGNQVAGAAIAEYFFGTFSSCVWGTVMARASAYRRVGIFDPSFGFISDVDMWLRLAYGSPVAYVPEPLIDLVPREPTHPYFYFSWRILLWEFAIFAKHWPKYRNLIALEAPRDAYVALVRRKCLGGLLSLVKHRQWARVREGLAILQDSDDPVLRKIGLLFGNHNSRPLWFQPECWRKIQLDDTDFLCPVPHIDSLEPLQGRGPRQ
jgi:glycosyltransferase involved in cell wall biosynthesis